MTGDGYVKIKGEGRPKKGTKTQAKKPAAGPKARGKPAKGMSGPKPPPVLKTGESFAKHTPLDPGEVNKGKISLPSPIPETGAGSERSFVYAVANVAKVCAAKANRTRSVSENASEAIVILVDSYVSRNTGVKREIIIARETDNVTKILELTESEAKAASSFVMKIFK